MQQYDWIIPATTKLHDVQIVFAEESPEAVEKIQEIVTDLNWSGHYVHNAKELIDKTSDLMTQGTVIDAIVADIHYFTGPKLTGITAARVIRKVMPDVPFLFLSSHSSSMIREEVRRVDAELLSKPVDMGQLFERLTQLVYWYRMAGSQNYPGIDRRKTSINLTEHARRAADQILVVPARIVASLAKGTNERR